MARPLLVLGNKRYSSWSLRGWIGLRSAGVDFDEQVIALDQPDTAAEIAKYSTAGRVPVLVAGELTVFDSLAILEFANDVLAPGSLLPPDAVRRARIRSVSAEMHAGFPNLRASLPMDLGRPPAPVAIDDPTRGEVSRILGLWESLRNEHHADGPYLFGAWSMADCCFAPVATRFHHYAVPTMDYPRAAEYIEQVLGRMDYREWREAALKEAFPSPLGQG